MALAALYTAERTYYDEHDAFSQNLLEIGVGEQPETSGDCDSKFWSIKAYTRRQNQGFIGVATSLVTSEIWEINERKQLRQVRK